MREFGVSWATAKRDLVMLEAGMPVMVEEIPSGRYHPIKQLRAMR